MGILQKVTACIVIHRQNYLHTLIDDKDNLVKSQLNSNNCEEEDYKVNNHNKPKLKTILDYCKQAI